MYKQAGDAVDAAQLTQEAQRIRGAADESNSPFPSRPVSWAGVQLERDRMQLAAKINYAAMRAEQLADERTRAGGGVPSRSGCGAPGCTEARDLSCAQQRIPRH